MVLPKIVFTNKQVWVPETVLARCEDTADSISLLEVAPNRPLPREETWPDNTQVMNVLDYDLEVYSTMHSQPETPLLQKIRRETYLQVLMPHMLSGPLQGGLLAMLVRLARARRVLEIGTFTGYATLWMAQALPEGGLIHTIDRNEELEDRVRGYFRQSEVASRICYHVGDAPEVISTLGEIFDLVFIDADKENYQRYYELTINQVRPGGCIIVDNVLWSGKVLADEKASDRKTRAMQAFNSYVHQDLRVENVLLPLRDGLMLLRKRDETNETT